jgi:hypothetical protein
VFSARLVDRYSIGREHWFDFEIGGTVYQGMAPSKGAHESGEIAVTLDLDHVHLFDANGNRMAMGGAS